MTQARARALENEVTSFLSDITYDPLETWLLPKSDMLCMIRCQEDPPGDVHEDGQVAKPMDEENQREESRTPPRPRTSGQDHEHPAPGASSSAASQPPTIYRPRTSVPSLDIRPEPGNPARSPDIRRHALEPIEVVATNPYIRPPSPDIRPFRKARTSSPVCLRTVKGRSPCTLSPRRLYILSHLPLSRVRIGLAHM